MVNGMTDRAKDFFHKLLILFSVLFFAFVFFLIAVNSWDNHNSTFSYRLEGDGATIEGYSGNPTGTFAIPSEIEGHTVKKIADNAFSGQSGIKKLILPDRLEEIGSFAFSGCTSLRTVNIGKNLRIIGDNAFSGCFYLKKIDFPDSLEKIGASSFEGCHRIGKLIIPSGCTSFGEDAFLSCTELIFICGDNEKAMEYAKSNLIPTGYADSNSGVHIYVCIVVVCSFALVAIAFWFIKRRSESKNKKVQKNY